MISWIQKSFQHHFRVIFAVLLAVTIISFIFTIGAGSGFGTADHHVVNHPFFHHNLAAEGDMAVVQREAELSSILNQQNESPLGRLAALDLADKLHLPAPSDSELKDFLRSLPAFNDEKGEFDTAKYNLFQASIRGNTRYPEALVRQVLDDDFRISRVATLLGGPGYVQPHEVREQLARFDTSWTLGIATLDYKSFTPAIHPTDLEIAKFFADHSANYEFPPMVSVRYADFPSSDYVAQVTPTEAEIKAFFDANPARFSKPAAPGKAPTTPNFNDPAVRLQAELACRLDQAARIAAKAASDFSLELYNHKIEPGTPAFEELLVAKKLKLKDAPPFARDEPPVEFDRSPEVAEEAFKLNSDRRYTDAIALPTGSVVLFWNENIPARQPALDEVKAKVTSDYIEETRRRQFVDLGRSLRAQLEAHLKAGDTFEKAVAAASASSGVKIEAKTLPPFTLRQRPQDLDYLVFGTLENLKKGEVSEMVAGPEKGLLVYAQDKKAPDVSETNPDFKLFQAQIARNSAARDAAESLHEMIDTEMARGEPAPAR